MNSNTEFTSFELHRLDEAVLLAEELVNEFYKMSSSHWLKNRYDIKTAKDLSPHEIITGPFAQVLGYVAKKKDVCLESFAFNFYTICLQDKTILDFLKKNKELGFFPFLVYILVHELVHIVRFSKFEQRYSASEMSDVVDREEKKVHGLTQKILKHVSISGMDKIREYYRQSPENLNFDKVF